MITSGVAAACAVTAIAACFAANAVSALGQGAIFGLAAVLLTGLARIVARRVASQREPDSVLSRGLSFGFRRLVRGFVTGFLGGFAILWGISFVTGLLYYSRDGLTVDGGGRVATAMLLGIMNGIQGGVIAGAAVGFLSSLGGAPSDLAATASPRLALARDRKAALTRGLATGLPFISLGLGLDTAWPSYMLARAWLALHRQLPWRPMSFLADAHQRAVLRQAGAIYQFRHIELQRRLATRDPASRDK